MDKEKTDKARDVVRKIVVDPEERARIDNALQNVIMSVGSLDKGLSAMLDSEARKAQFIAVCAPEHKEEMVEGVRRIMSGLESMVDSGADMVVDAAGALSDEC